MSEILLWLAASALFCSPLIAMAFDPAKTVKIGNDFWILREDGEWEKA